MALLEVNNISKAYHGNPVLEDVCFAVREGETLGILGVNGSGKSTLVRLISGDIFPDSGNICHNGQQVRWRGPADAINCKIATVHQNFDLIPDLTAAENVYIYGCNYAAVGRLSLRKMANLAYRLFVELNINIDPYVRVSKLGAAEKQLLKIAAAMSKVPSLLIIDEPFLMLSDSECSCVTNLIKTIKNRGTAIIFTTGNIANTLDIADNIAILKEEHLFSQDDIKNRSIDFFVKEISDTATYRYPRISNIGKRKVLCVKNMTTHDRRIKDISFYLCSGEILGIAGAPGAGKSTLAKALFGAEKLKNGEITVNGISCKFRDPADAVNHRIGIMSGNSTVSGLIASFTCAQNISLSNLSGVSEYGILKAHRERETACKYIKKYGIKPAQAEALAVNMSEGQRQKTVFCKWLQRDCNVLIMDNATKGVDISAKVELYNLMNAFAMGGGSILFISSDYNELLGMCDRMIALKSGRISGIIEKTDFSMHSLIDTLSK